MRKNGSKSRPGTYIQWYKKGNTNNKGNVKGYVIYFLERNVNNYK